MFSDVNSFIQETKNKRTERATKIKVEESRDNAILIIQRNIRGWLARTKFKKKILYENLEKFVFVVIFYCCVFFIVITELILMNIYKMLQIKKILN